MELRLIDDAFVKICDMVNDCSVSVRTEAAKFLVRSKIRMVVLMLSYDFISHAVPFML